MKLALIALILGATSYLGTIAMLKLYDWLEGLDSDRDTD